MVVKLINPPDYSPFDLEDDIKQLIQYLDYIDQVGQELSLPINPRLANLEYLPTQYLCEFIKGLGFDGVAFTSAVGEGFNLALFSDKNTRVSSAKLYEIVGANFQTKQVI